MESEKTPIQPALLTIPQVCAYLNVARPTFYKIRATGALAPLPVGLCRKVLYNRVEIEAWICAGCPHRKQWQAMRISKLEKRKE